MVVPQLNRETPTRMSAAAAVSYVSATFVFTVVLVSDPCRAPWRVALGLGAWADWVDTGAFYAWLATSIWAALVLMREWSTTLAKLVVAVVAWGSGLLWIGLRVVQRAEPMAGYEGHSLVTAGFPLMGVVRVRDDRSGISQLHRFYSGLALDGSLLAFGLNALMLAVVASALCALLIRRFGRSVPLVGLAIGWPATMSGMAFVKGTLPYPL